ncbi:MAG: VOC family protein [Pseudomonadota bacterium]
MPFAIKRPPHAMSPLMWRFGGLMKQRWFRSLVLLGPTLSGKRASNKAEDYGVFKPSLVSHTEQLAIYVSDIAVSRDFYERLLGLEHSRTTAAEPHPTQEGWSVVCCYLSAEDHPECIVLIEQSDASGARVPPTGGSFFHFALMVKGDSLAAVEAFAKSARKDGFRTNYGVAKHNSEPPLGDGESGGNVACYFYDPDWNNIEVFGEMDTIDNYRERYGDRKGSERTG